jgi:hypothetical protein
METATAVLTTTKRIVLRAILPNFIMSETDEIPATNEKNTSGTTISLSKFLKISPPRFKTTE